MSAKHTAGSAVTEAMRTWCARLSRPDDLYWLRTEPRAFDTVQRGAIRLGHRATRDTIDGMTDAGLIVWIQRKNDIGDYMAVLTAKGLECAAIAKAEGSAS